MVSSFGLIEVVQGQDLSQLAGAIKEVKSGKTKIENVADAFCAEYKRVYLDPTFYQSEYMHIRENNLDDKYTETKLNIPELSNINLNDTISLGEVEVRNFEVGMKQNEHNSNDKEINSQTKSVRKNILGLKINLEHNNGGENSKRESFVGYGESIESAINATIREMIYMKGSRVKMITNDYFRIESGPDGNQTKNILVELYTEEKNLILENFQIIINKMSDKDYKEHYRKLAGSRKEIRKYNKEDSRIARCKTGIPKDRCGGYFNYSAKIIYKEHSVLK